MNFIVDIGNSATKVYVFKDGEMCFKNIYNNLTCSDVEKIFDEYKIQKSVISSVKEKNNKLENILIKKTKYLNFTSKTPLPIKTDYQTPNTLGLDRIAAVVGAVVQFPKQNILTIDVGTCITYDFITQKNIYKGGSISPGIEMRLKALHQFTGKLPKINTPKETNHPIIGNTTEASILSGVSNGIKKEMEGVVEEYLKLYPSLKIIITGGDQERFDLITKNRIFVNSFLVANGLNEILEYNLNKI